MKSMKLGPNDQILLPFLSIFVLFALKNKKNLPGQNERIVVLNAHKGLAYKLDPAQAHTFCNILRKVESKRDHD